jgi:hypothetical protein
MAPAVGPLRTGMAGKPMAGGGGSRLCGTAVVADPLKERDVEKGFQLVNLAADGALRQIQLDRGASDAFVPRDALEGLKTTYGRQLGQSSPPLRMAFVTGILC